jgi:hypothetical protein
MGRPLNKKYFGNRNQGTGGYEVTGNLSNSQNYADDRIGGEGVDYINWSTLGAFRGNGTFGITGLALPAPSLPGGVQATWTLLFEVEGVSTGAGKTNLAVGDTFGHASIPGLIAKVTDLSGANAVFSVTASGASRGNALAYASLLADTQGLTLTKIAGSGTASTFLVDLNYRVKSAAIVEKGSGYTGTETFTAVVTGNGGSQTAPAGTLVLTTDSGAVGSSTNQENAIIMYANTSGSGSTGLAADVIKQVNTRTYKVKTSDGIGKVKLSTDSTPATGYAYMVATSASGATYYVTKLTAHRATLVAKTGDEALDGMSVQWTLGSPTGSIVQIENA